jgi:RNA polymerase sigma factor FliA
VPTTKIQPPTPPVLSRASAALDAGDRLRLIRQHLPLVGRLARTVHAELGGWIDLEELVAFGNQGLVEAAARYRQDRGAAFSTFAYHRIRGAIYDGVRAHGPLPHHYYRLARRAAEQAEHGGTRERTFDTTPRWVGVCRRGDVDRLTAASGRAEFRVDEQLNHHQLRAHLGRAIAGLPRRERQLVQRHYYGEASLEEAGREMGVSKSWASRLHARALRSLRGAIAAHCE